MNTTALATIQRDEMSTIQEAAKTLALSNYFDGKGNTPQAIAMMATKILAGREMGFGPFASVNGIHIINGKPSVGANLMAAAVKGNGRYDYRVREMTNDKCVIEFFERDGNKRVSIGISEFTKEDAKAAGTQNMSKFPRNMMFARAMSNGVKWYCPDVFNGNTVYVPEELGAEVDDEGNVIETTGRVVESTPSPTTDNYDVDGDVIFAPEPSRPVATQSRLNMMHALGMEFHGNKEAWDTARPTWVEAASKGAIKSSKELMPKECEWIIASLQKKINQRNAQPEAVAA